LNAAYYMAAKDIYPGANVFVGPAGPNVLVALALVTRSVQWWMTSDERRRHQGLGPPERAVGVVGTLWCVDNLDPDLAPDC
jgi:hypothetical protein